MSSKPLIIGFVRRGYSPSGGAEAYLKRLGQGVAAAGHEARLFTTGDWPEAEWGLGAITRVRGNSATAFADELERLQPKRDCDVVMSLERIWRCDVYRAGDGVHRAWLQRRTRFETTLERMLRAFNPKHRELLRLEESLFAQGKAGHVIANSKMVKNEITQLYNYPSERIGVVYNGVPQSAFQGLLEMRENSRAAQRLAPDEIAFLFAGSGWERKGLRFAIEAIESLNAPKFRLLVAGRGNERKFRSKSVQFLGELADLCPAYAAADIFLLPTIYDPFSNASLEALASGLPVITTRANGFSEIMEDGVHGSILDRSDDLEALRTAILYWSAAERRRSARPTILARAAQFDISRNVGETLEIIAQVAERAAST